MQKEKFNFQYIPSLKQSIYGFHTANLLIQVVDPRYDLAHCGLLTPYGNKDLGQQWLR